VQTSASPRVDVSVSVSPSTGPACSLCTAFNYSRQQLESHWPSPSWSWSPSPSHQRHPLHHQQKWQKHQPPARETATKISVVLGKTEAGKSGLLGKKGVSFL